jgi:ABC-type glycerol-3-phosphate transport system substrate-binding protein
MKLAKRPQGPGGKSVPHSGRMTQRGRWLGLSLIAAASGLAACGDSTGPDPLPPLSAHAGQDQDVAVSSLVQLDAAGSTSTDATLTWTQHSGPPVGTLSSATPAFTAPADVSTLVFELRVARGSATERDTVWIWVLEDPANQHWVRSGGNDTNPGSRAQPFALLRTLRCLRGCVLRHTR